MRAKYKVNTIGQIIDMLTRRRARCYIGKLSMANFPKILDRNIIFVTPINSTSENSEYNFM